MDLRAELERLHEGRRLEGVPLSRAEAAALNATRLVTVQPAAIGWSVTASHVVGAVRCGDLTVRVAPKVGSVQVLRLLARAHGLAKLDLDDASVGLHDDADLSLVLAAMYLREAAQALAAGPMRGYRSEEQSLPVLRGRLRMREQEVRRFGLLQPLEVLVDEWTLDTDDNRRLRAAHRVLLGLPGLPDRERAQLLHYERLLQEAAVPTAGARLPPWTATRLNARLRRLLALADLVLNHASVEHRVGEVQVSGFVLSMAWLFEALVTRLLAESTRPVRVHAQQGHALDTLGRLRIVPDIVLTEGATVLAVADTKYKLLDEHGAFPNADAYQLVTYCQRLGLTEGHLIYAAGDPQPAPYEIVETDIVLHVHAVDLAQSLPGIESDVRELAELLDGQELRRRRPEGVERHG